jgi:hypothetical protein
MKKLRTLNELKKSKEFELEMAHKNYEDLKYHLWTKQFEAVVIATYLKKKWSVSKLELKTILEQKKNLKKSISDENL